MTMGNETSSTGFGASTSGSPEAVADAGRDVKEDAKRLGSEVAALAATKASQARDTAQEYYQTGKDKAQEYMETGKEKAQEYYDISKAKAQEWESDVEQYIREKPLQSVLIAAGVGAVIGLLLRR